MQIKYPRHYLDNLKTNLYVETDRNKILEQIKLNASKKGMYKTMAHKLELTLANFDEMLNKERHRNDALSNSLRAHWAKIGIEL